ncbi:MAG: GxxExxY protein [Bacteroidales bacterium]|nr:GxxExxY protein [Bacteroidales bacterium]
MSRSEDELSEIIVNTCYSVHEDLGPGLLESVYEEILYYELKSKGLKVARQVALPLVWKNVKMGIGFRANLVVENKIIVELKSVDQIAPIHMQQLKTYLKISGINLGLLVNFNKSQLKEGITRVINKH